MSKMNEFIQSIKGQLDTCGGLSVNKVLNYFRRINIPDDLCYIDHIAAEMKNVCAVLETVANDNDRYVLNEWNAINNLILSSIGILRNLKVRLLVDEKKDDNKKKASVYGYKESNALFCVLWYVVDVKTYPIQYLMLKSILFRVFENLKINTTLNNCYQCSLIFRALGQEEYKDILRLLPATPQTVDSYIDSLRQILSVNENKKIKGFDFIDKLLDNILKSEGLKEHKFHNHHGGAGGKGGGIGPGVAPSKQRLEFIDSTEDTTDPEFEKIKVYRLTEFDEKGFSEGDFDLKSNDYVNEYDVLELIPRSEDYVDLDPKLEALRLNGKKAALAMQSHFLPTHRSVMSLWEIGNIFKYITLSFISENMNLRESEIVIILSLILLTGRDLEEICNTKIINKTDTELQGYTVAYVRSERCIKLRIFSPEYKTKLFPEQKLQAIPVNNELILPLPCILAENINKIIEIKKAKKCLFQGKLFSGEKGDYIKSVNKIIRKLSQSSSTEVALRRFIFQRFLSVSSDLVDPMMITNQRYGIPSSRLHYTTKSQHALVENYCAAFNEFVTEVVDEFEIEDSIVSSWSLNNNFTYESYIGARSTPKIETVKKLIDGLKDEIKKHKNRDWIEYHNAYTTYCILMLDYATGTRSVSRKYFLQSDIDFTKKQMLVWDKSAGDSLNSRIVHLPDLCIEQLLEYHKYRKHLVNKLIGMSDTNYTTLLSDRSQSPTSYFKSKLRNHVEIYIGQFFLLNKSGNPINIKPLYIREQIKEIFHLPLNTNRHYIRFNFMLEKIPGEFIDAFMGHSSNGEEPYGRYSFLTLNEVIEETGTCIDKILNRDGWSVISGVEYDY